MACTHGVTNNTLLVTTSIPDDDVLNTIVSFRAPQ
jgi:hypothetical protein